MEALARISDMVTLPAVADLRSAGVTSAYEFFLKSRRSGIRSETRCLGFVDVVGLRGLFTPRVRPCQPCAAAVFTHICVLSNTRVTTAKHLEPPDPLAPHRPLHVNVQMLLEILVGRLGELHVL